MLPSTLAVRGDALRASGAARAAPAPVPAAPLTAGPAPPEPPAQRRHPRPQRCHGRHGRPARGPSAQAQRPGAGAGAAPMAGSGAWRCRWPRDARSGTPGPPALRPLTDGTAVLLGLCGRESSFITDACGVCSALSVPGESP